MGFPKEAASCGAMHSGWISNCQLDLDSENRASLFGAADGQIASNYDVARQRFVGMAIVNGVTLPSS